MTTILRKNYQALALLHVPLPFLGSKSLFPSSSLSFSVVSSCASSIQVTRWSLDLTLLTSQCHHYHRLPNHRPYAVFNQCDLRRHHAIIPKFFLIIDHAVYNQCDVVTSSCHHCHSFLSVFYVVLMSEWIESKWQMKASSSSSTMLSSISVSCWRHHAIIDIVFVIIFVVINNAVFNQGDFRCLLWREEWFIIMTCLNRFWVLTMKLYFKTI